MSHDCHQHSGCVFFKLPKNMICFALLLVTAVAPEDHCGRDTGPFILRPHFWKSVEKWF